MEAVQRFEQGLNLCFSIFKGIFAASALFQRAAAARFRKNEEKSFTKLWALDCWFSRTNDQRFFSPKKGAKDWRYDTAAAVGEAVAAKEYDRGILICGTGIGVCIAANKVKGVYAALLNNVYQAERAQLSNNANVITLGAQVTGIELGKCLVREYLANTYDSASRSGPKVQAIVEYEAAN